MPEAHRNMAIRVGQRQPQIRDITKVAWRPDLHHVDIRCRAIGLRVDQSQNPPHPRSPAGNGPTGHIASVLIPHFLDTPGGRGPRSSR